MSGDGPEERTAAFEESYERDIDDADVAEQLADDATTPLACAHTPGPWRISEGREAPDKKHRFVWSDAETREEREDNSPYCVATVHERTFCTQLDANARLIAAAPDLAEALAALLYACDSPELIVKARAALAKAGL